MSQAHEGSFSIKQQISQPILTHNDVTPFTINVVLLSSTTQYTEQNSTKTTMLDIPKNESIDEAEDDMDRLAQRSLEDVETSEIVD